MFSHSVHFLYVLAPILAQDLFEKQNQFLSRHDLVMQIVNPNVTGLGAASSDSYYKTITPSGANNLCIDVPGGNGFNGAFLQLWECNGADGQIWVFDKYQIRLGIDENLCIDADSMENGHQLMLWECNGWDQQTWGWDGDASRVYLYGRSDGTCLDWFDQDFDNGQPLHVWECNDNPNQQWSLWASGAPGGGGGGEQFFPSDHCFYDAGGWPSFQQQSDLENDQYWSVYFQRIYGGIPTSGYPICPGAFQFMWKLSAAAAGIVTFDPVECAGDGSGDMSGQELDSGIYYAGMNKAIEGWDVSAYIYNPNLWGVAVPANNWVEVTHTVFPGDKGAIWYYMSVGSGVWVNVGNTAVYKDHSDAVTDMLHQTCSDEQQDKFGDHPTECEQNFEELFKAALSQGYDTIQFTEHFDCTCGPQGDSSYKYSRHCPTEIVALNDPNGASSGCSDLLKGGWEASGGCNCDSSFTSAAFDPKCAGGCGYANCGAS